MTYFKTKLYIIDRNTLNVKCSLCDLIKLLHIGTKSTLANEEF